MLCLISLDFYILPLASSTSCTVILSIPGTPLFCLTFSIVIFKFSLLLPSRITFPSSRLSSLSNYPNIAYSDLHSINVSVLQYFYLLRLHLISYGKPFSTEGTITDFKVYQNSSSIRPPGVRHKPFFFHNVLIYCLGFTFTFRTSVCIATLSTIQPHQVSVRTLKRIVTPLPSPMTSLSTACGSLHLAVTTCGWFISN